MPPRRRRQPMTGGRRELEDGSFQYQARLTEMFQPKSPPSSRVGRNNTRSATTTPRPLDSTPGPSSTPKRKNGSSRKPSSTSRATRKPPDNTTVIDISSDSEVVPLPKRRKIFPETPASKTAVNTPLPPSTIRGSITDLSSSPTLADMTPCLNTTIKKTGAFERTRRTWEVSPTRREPSILFCTPEPLDQSRNEPSSPVTFLVDDDSDVVPSSQTQPSHILVEAQPSDYRGVWGSSTEPKTSSKTACREDSRGSVVPSSQTPERSRRDTVSIHSPRKLPRKQSGSLRSSTNSRGFLVPGTVDSASSILVSKGHVMSSRNPTTSANASMESLHHLSVSRSPERSQRLDEGSQTQNTDTQGLETQDTMDDDGGSRLLAQLRLDPPFAGNRVSQYKDERRWREYRLKATPPPSERESYSSVVLSSPRNRSLDDNACVLMTPSPTKRPARVKQSPHPASPLEDVQLSLIQDSPLRGRSGMNLHEESDKDDESMPPDVRRFLFSESYQESMENYILESSQSQA